MTSFKKDWEELNLSHEEVNNLTEALKKEEFRKLLIEYVEETQAPENRKKYQDDIVQLEAERGIDCQFINPTPAFVIKTSIDGVGKAFINVASNPIIGKPNLDGIKPNESNRLRPISLPYSLTPGRDDYDKKSQHCVVYDAVFHPDTLCLAQSSPQIKKCVIETALNGVETEFNVKLDKRNIKLPKLKYKGAFYAAVIRKPSEHPPEKSEEDLKILEQLKFPEIPPPPRQPTKKAVKPEPVSEFTTPHYVIKYRNDIDLQEYTLDRNAKQHAAIPKELVIDIYLPLLSSSKNIKLDIASKSLDLICEKSAKYKLNLCLPYTVSEEGSAKFDVDKKRLIVTLPVIRKAISLSGSEEKSICEYVREDSGVESDAGEPLAQERPDNESDEELVAKPKPPESFLSKDHQYTLPAFDYNRENNSLCFVLNVKNVDPTSIAHIKIEDHGFHIKFTSIGSGFFPIHYAFYAKFPSTLSDDITVEAWDNNVTALVRLAALKHEDSIWIGTCAEDAKEKKVDGILDLTKAVDDLILEEEEDERRDNIVTIVSADAEEVVFDVEFNAPEESDSEEADDKVGPPPKARTYSEGSSDEMPGGARRGILKNRLNRSLSESCADSVNINGGVLYTWSESCLPEEEREVKKTVRFSQKIQEQIFRANSSILGQRKKNQKRTRNRRKALERRASESENSEGEEKEKWMKKAENSVQEQKTPHSVLKPVISATDGKRKKAGKKSTTRPVQFSSGAVTQLSG